MGRSEDWRVSILARSCCGGERRVRIGYSPEESARGKEGREGAGIDACQLHEGQEPQVGHQSDAAPIVVADYAPDGSALTSPYKRDQLESSSSLGGRKLDEVMLTTMRKSIVRVMLVAIVPLDLYSGRTVWSVRMTAATRAEPNWAHTP